MDAAELSQFLRILAVAFGALFAAPIVVFLAEAADRRSERERDQRRISTQHPVMQY